MCKKVNFSVHCIDCGKPEKIHDYIARWQTGNYRCGECFETWYKKQPPAEIKLYDIMAQTYVTG